MEINLIVAISKNNVIGKNGELVFHIKKDMTRFKELTTGNVIIMGSKTFESLPNGALPNRVNIVVTHNKKEVLNKKENLFYVTSIEEAIKLYESWFYFEDGVVPCKQLFVIGGGTVYKYCLDNDLIDKMYITRINQTIDNGDTFFPEFDENEWVKNENQEFNEESLSYTFETWKKR